MQLVNMKELTEPQRQQAAIILTESLPLGWPTLQDAQDELTELLIPENTLLAALENDEVIGWGGILAPSYDGRVFELHPLAVRADQRKRGVGRAIVTALEEAARRQGGLILQLGADDEGECGETSLANVDLFDHLPDKLQSFVPGTHQSAFYMKLGYKIIGVVPEANGPGKPDIIFAKRL